LSTYRYITHFSSYEDHDEIVSDIESRIAEKLASKVSSQKQAVGLGDIELVTNRLSH